MGLSDALAAALAAPATVADGAVGTVRAALPAALIAALRELLWELFGLLWQLLGLIWELLLLLCEPAALGAAKCCTTFPHNPRRSSTRKKNNTLPLGLSGTKRYRLSLCGRTVMLHVFAQARVTHRRLWRERAVGRSQCQPTGSAL